MSACYVCDRKPETVRLPSGVPVCAACVRMHRLYRPAVAVRTPIPDEKTDPAVNIMGSFAGYQGNWP